MEFLKVINGRITLAGRPVYLRGVNLGGWLMPEGYLLHAPNRGYRFFRRSFIKKLGSSALAELEQAFRDNFITEDDFRCIAGLGFDHVRLPFHYALVESAPYHCSKTGLAYLDRAVSWAGKFNLRVILDMHAVPGAQNADWHSDSDGRAGFWTSAVSRQRAVALWQMLAEHFADERTVIGYDILNEAVTDDVKTLNSYYHKVIASIRKVDKNHVIFVEGNRWAQDIACLDLFEDDDLVLGIHFYEPLECTFNFYPGLRYPMPGWDRDVMRRRLEASLKIAQQRGRALWCGEFGVHSRDGHYGEAAWVEDIISHFQAMGIHWTYWTWKAVKHYMFPDGIMSYRPNDPWVNRQGPETGWDCWAGQWPVSKAGMIASWRTAAFTQNEVIVKALWKK